MKLNYAAWNHSIGMWGVSLNLSLSFPLNIPCATKWSQMFRVNTNCTKRRNSRNRFLFCRPKLFSQQLMLYPVRIAYWMPEQIQIHLTNTEHKTHANIAVCFICFVLSFVFFISFVHSSILWFSCIHILFCVRAALDCLLAFRLIVLSSSLHLLD